MVEVDQIAPPVVIKKTLTFDLKDLYKHMKSALKDNGYSVKEKSYDEDVTADGSKKTAFLWEADKKASDYVKLVITVDFVALTKNVIVKEDDSEHKAQRGQVTLKFLGFTKRDPEGEWELHPKKPYGAFFRELYDKFAKKDRMSAISENLEDDLSKVIDETKLFLKMRKYE